LTLDKVDANDITLNKMKKKKKERKTYYPSEQLCYSLFIFDIRKTRVWYRFQIFWLWVYLM